MYPFSTTWKHHKALKLCNIFRRSRKGALGSNGLMQGTPCLKPDWFGGMKLFPKNNCAHVIVNDTFKFFPKCWQRYRSITLDTFLASRLCIGAILAISHSVGKIPDFIHEGKTVYSGLHNTVSQSFISRIPIW